MSSTCFSVTFPTLSLFGAPHAFAIRRRVSDPHEFLRCLLLHLFKFQLHRSRASEDGDHHLQRFSVLVHVVDNASESCEWPLADPHRFALLKFNFELRPILRL